METEQLMATILEQKTLNLEIVEQCPYPEKAGRLSITEAPGKKNRFNLYCEYMGANCGGETFYLSSVHINKVIDAIDQIKTVSGYDFLLASLEESKPAVRPQQGNYSNLRGEAWIISNGLKKMAKRRKVRMNL